jgi:hypothetical protein
MLQSSETKLVDILNYVSPVLGYVLLQALPSQCIEDDFLLVATILFSNEAV